MSDFITKANPWIAAAEAVMNPVFAHLTNVKQRKFTREMYGRQRQDALADYEMQNTYNSPRAQMQRFQEAGLNPNLIYGQSNEGATVRSSSSSGGNATPPEISGRGMRESLMQGYDIKQRSAQTDLLAKQLQLMDEDIKLRTAQQWATVAGTGKTHAETEGILFDLGIRKDLRETTIEGKQAEVGRLKAETEKIIMEMAQMALTNPLKVQEMVLDILQKQKNVSKTDAEINEINARINLAKQELTIKGFDEMLVKRGINPKDPGAIRFLQEKIRRLIEPVGEAAPRVGTGLFKHK